MPMYDNKKEVVISGTASISEDSSTIVGVDTLFSNEITAGQFFVLEDQFFQVLSVSSNTSMSVRPVAEADVDDHVIRIRPIPGFLPYEIAQHIRYYDNTDISKPAIRALGIKSPGWVYHKQVVGATRTRNFTEVMAVQNQRYVDIFDKSRIIVLGASITRQGFSDGMNTPTANASIIQAGADLRAALGFRGSWHLLSVGGHTMAQTTEVAIQAKIDYKDTEGNNLYILDTGGNDVTNNRPYDSSEYAGLWSGLEFLADLLMSNGDELIILPLSKRLYTTSPVITAGNTAQAENGSKPYNDNVWYPFMAKYTPKWMQTPTSPFMDFYGFTERNEREALRASDGVHHQPGSFTGIQQSILGGIVKGAKRISNVPENRRGRSYLINPSASFYTDYTSFVNHCRIDQQGAANQGKGAYALLRDLSSGEFDFHMEWACRGFRGWNTGGDATWAEAHIADPRMAGHSLFDRSSYIDAANAANTAVISVRNLIEGESGTITLAGSRAVADNSRQATVTLNGVSVGTLNAANNAVSNSLSFPFTVGANGSIEIVMSVSAGTGHLSAMMVNFD